MTPFRGCSRSGELRRLLGLISYFPCRLKDGHNSRPVLPVQTAR
jgi:hypothetical protein